MNGRNRELPMVVTMIMFLGLLTITNIIFSCERASATECPHPVQSIKQGVVANCDGFLFSDQAEKDAAEARDDNKYYNVLVPKLKLKINKEIERNDILEKRLDLYIRQSEVLAKDKVKTENRIFWERVGLFILGAGVMYGGFELANGR